MHCVVIMHSSVSFLVPFLEIRKFFACYYKNINMLLLSKRNVSNSFITTNYSSSCKNNPKRKIDFMKKKQLQMKTEAGFDQGYEIYQFVFVHLLSGIDQPRF